jgi:uncharacterized membrane protein
MGVTMLAFWGLIAVLVLHVVRNLAHRSPQHTETASPDTAMRILGERFASGEIDADDYNQRRDLLRSR